MLLSIGQAKCIAAAAAAKEDMEAEAEEEKDNKEEKEEEEEIEKDEHSSPAASLRTCPYGTRRTKRSHMALPASPAATDST